MKSEASVAFSIPQTTLGAGGYPIQTLGVAYLLNITVVTSGTGTATLTTWDDLGDRERDRGFGFHFLFTSR